MSAPPPASAPRFGRTALLNAGLVVLVVLALLVLALRHGGPDRGVEVSRRDPPAGVDEVAVQVTGAVASPGMIIAEPGDRVEDVIESAGGALPGAALDDVNLALRVRDQDAVHVPFEGEAGATLLDLNTATQAELETLPGIGPARAAAIIDARPLNDPRDVLDRDLIPAPVWEEIRSLVTAR